jgi:tRNA A58 N-methylase Trm61
MSMVCPSWLSFILYNPVRKTFSDRSKILRESGITEGSVVIEAGAGNGFLTEVLTAVAKKVIVVELQEGMVRKLKKRVSRYAEKVDIIRGNVASCDLQAGIADVCLLYYSFHEFSDKPGAVRNIVRAVKNRGIISLYEPTVEVGKKNMEKTVEMFAMAGFKKEMEYTTLFTRFVRLRKANEQAL